MNMLRTSLGEIVLQNPVLCASGCFGHGYEMQNFTDLSKPGAVSLKTVTQEPRKGNPTPRICEIHGGILSSIGMQNPGFDAYVREEIPMAQQGRRPDQIFLSIAGGGEREYLSLAERVFQNYDRSQIAALEINTACPNVEKGGGMIGKDTDLLYHMLKKIVARSPIPVIAKINTAFDGFLESAKAAEAAGVQALYTTNTPLGMAIDIQTGRPAIGNIKAPLSGPVIKPFGIGKTWELYQELHIPIIASGGICCTEDVIEYMMAGASAVGIGAYQFVNPNIVPEIVDGLRQYVEEHQLSSIQEIVGFTSRIIKNEGE